jgi:hypothetical protein
VPAIGKLHARRLRDLYRSAGWPSQDAIEVELLAAGLLERQCTTQGHERVRLTDAGLSALACAFQTNRKAKSAHDALVDQVAQSLLRDGRIVWTSLSLRARLPTETEETARWRICMPDVFSIRNTSVAHYLEPVVHEIKVNRADFLGDLRSQDKRDSYLNVGGQCWYVLGLDARGRPIAQADEVPPECGVLIAGVAGLTVARHAPKRAAADLPFSIWMALAKSTPLTPLYALHCEAPASQSELTEYPLGPGA